jgi:tetratricopeptide (TPR) repeat protein
MSRMLIVISLLVFIIPVTALSQNAETYLNQGQTLYKSGRYDEALSHFLKYAELKPQDVPAYYWLGWTYYRLAKYDTAIENFNKANAIREVWDTYLGLGECYYALKDYEKALSNFTLSRKLKPEETSCYQWLGYSYFNLHNYNEAIENFIQANTLKESYANYNWLGQCYSALEDYETALKYNLKFAGLQPQNADSWLPYNRLGWNYYYLQMYYDAIEQFRESIKIKPVTYSYIGLCKIYSALGEYDKSQEILNTILNRVETDAEKRDVKFLLGYNHVAQGRYEEAFKVFGKTNTLGIEMRNVSAGERITGVLKNGPADLAGLKNGDVLQEFAGIPLQGKPMTEFITSIIPQPQFGSKVKIKIYRDGYIEDKYMYIGLSPEIYNLALNDADLSKQREQVQAAKSKSKINVAVVELTAQGLSAEETSALTARVRSELFNTSKFNVLEREEMSTILDEHSLQQTGLTSDDHLVQAGKLLNVEYIVGGTISKVGQYYSVSLKLIDVETGKIKAMVTEDVPGTINDVLIKGMKESVHKLVQ